MIGELSTVGWTELKAYDRFDGFGVCEPGEGSTSPIYEPHPTKKRRPWLICILHLLLPFYRQCHNKKRILPHTEKKEWAGVQKTHKKLPPHSASQ